MEVSEHLDLPFFERPRTKSFVDMLAHKTPLLVYAGSGLTMDRTGLTWREFAGRLLEIGGTATIDADRIVFALGTQQAASAAVHSLYEQWGKAGWKRYVSDDIRKWLYTNRDWIPGRASIALAELWIESAVTGTPIQVLTTNYDEHFSLDLGEAIDLWKDTLEQQGRAVPDLPPYESFIKYLHGHISEDGVISQPVISERDVERTFENTLTTLSEPFSTSNVLMVGAGLQDWPLITALLKSKKSADGAGLRRVAIVPRADIKAIGPPEQSGPIIEAFENRLRHLGVTGLYVDHYSQVAQVLVEIRRASALDTGEYLGSDQAHGRRLRRWWEGFDKKISTLEKFAAIQRDHHAQLVQLRDGILAKLGREHERIKVELWLRWDPGERKRDLRLWASSFARFTDWRTARIAPIEFESKTVAINAFSAGQLIYKEERSPDERWKTYLALPLEAKGGIDFIVGAIVVASMNRPDDSCLRKRDRNKHGFALRETVERCREMIRE